MLGMGNQCIFSIRTGEGMVNMATIAVIDAQEKTEKNK
jgi:hypothetical protein